MRYVFDNCAYALTEILSSRGRAILKYPKRFSFAHDLGREDHRVMRSHKIRGSGEENDVYFVENKGKQYRIKPAFVFAKQMIV